MVTQKPVISKDAKILVLGDTGTVGKNVVSQLQEKGYSNIVLGHDPDGVRLVNVHHAKDINDYLYKERFEAVVMAGPGSSPRGTISDKLQVTLKLINIVTASLFCQPKMCILVGYETFHTNYLLSYLQQANADPENKCWFIYNDLKTINTPIQS